MKENGKIIVVPDSFKGGITSGKFCEIAENAIRRVFPAARIVVISVADGGEGTVDAFLSAAGGRKIKAAVKGPFFEDMESFYGILTDGTAVIETAACAGLSLVRGRKDPCLTTTYGVGQLIAHATQSGCKSIVLALGGSATNDAGCGMACALGAKFYDELGKEFVPTGGTLSRIDKIDLRGLKIDLPVTTMCDVDNLLYGDQGAAYVFAPQKGADGYAVTLLDDGLRHFARRVKGDFGVDVSVLKGGGAAGGLGAGAVFFLNGVLRMGIDVVLDTVSFDAQLEDTDLVITGEGKIDTQSLRGKAVIGVAQRAQKKNIPVIAFVGDIGNDIEAAYALGVSGIFSINRIAVPLEEAVLRSETDLDLTIENLMRFIRALHP